MWFAGRAQRYRKRLAAELETQTTELREEQERCERLGLELPLARCRERIRYWQFVHGLLSIAPFATPGGAA